MTTPVLSLIAAVARDGGIGRRNQLLWHESEDQKHFRRVTIGCPVVMGRKTWDSLPARFRPLPGRRNVVLTRDAAWRADGAERAASLGEALALLADAPKVFVIGGAQVYAEALTQADELVLTEIDAVFDADAFFPGWSRDDFDEVSSEARTTQGGTPYRFVTYRRRSHQAAER